jgi:hypothetical protein
VAPAVSASVIRSVLVVLCTMGGSGSPTETLGDDGDGAGTDARYRPITYRPYHSHSRMLFYRHSNMLFHRHSRTLFHRYSRTLISPSFPHAFSPSFPHAFGGNPVRSSREALLILVVLCTIGSAGSPTKTLGDDGDGVCGCADAETLKFRLFKFPIRLIPTHSRLPVFSSFPHAFGGNPVRSSREALLILVIHCTIGSAGSPTKTLGDDGDGVCGYADAETLNFRIFKFPIRFIPTHSRLPVFSSFPHALGGNPVPSYREALLILVVLCTIGSAGSPTKTLGDDGDGVWRDDGDGAGSDARY